MTNLPSYLTYESLDADGWPITLSPREKSWALSTIAQLLEERGSIGLTLRETRHRLFDEPDSSRLPGFVYARSEVWEWAVSYKVLTTVPTNQIWVSYDLRKEIDE